MNRQPRILCVDDEPLNLDLLEAILLPKGYDVVRALNGPEALERIRSERIDICLLDVMLPGMDGYELCARIKEAPATRNIPAIMITSLSDMESRLKGLESGADDFLSKPVERLELLARTGNLLKMKGYQDAIIEKNGELERLSVFKKDLADMIVHDLKGPLTSIQGYIQVAVMKNSEDEALLHYLSEAQAGCDSLLSMLNMLLDVGSMEEGKMPLNRMPVNVADLLRKVRDMVIIGAERQAKRVVVEAVPQLMIEADADLLERVLQNLVSNALRHVKKDEGEVRLSMKVENGRSVFSVSDNGVGIPAGFHKKIFEKYGQADNSAKIPDSDRQGRNKGLGLTFCKMAVEAHGGEIWVESEFGKGSRFVFSLPVTASNQ